MKEMIDQTEINVLSQKCENALLVTIQQSLMSLKDAEEHLEELVRLVDTMGIRIADKIIVKLKTMNPRYLIGKGKAEEIIFRARELKTDIIIFDDDLSPSQQRNWEDLSRITIIDRHEVILDIFAKRASTREAVLQVGLARMIYSLPRLTRAWTHLSRQRGGAKGTRGEGEKQLEVDRRLTLKKIDRFKRELKQVRKHRATQRKKRQRVPVPTASIVGYTNAGKSSLLNSLTQAQVFVEDKLFATLDPTTRRITFDNNQEILLTDTVGFIRKLPHDLVDAFKSTLEETVLSDFLIHVLDVSSPEVDHHYDTTLSVLKELEAEGKPILTVFNKLDLIERDSSRRIILRNKYPDCIFISIKTGEGIIDLKSAIKKLISEKLYYVEFRIPHNRYDLVALIHRNGHVVKETYHDDHISILGHVSEKIRMNLAEYTS